MSFANVLPSAPELYPMAEISQINAEDFRLKKISDLLKELSDEAEHYRQVAKKYKRTHSSHSSAVGLGSLSVGLSSGALATALTGFGIVASPALAGVAMVCGLSSVGFAAASKRLERKVTKHEKIYTLALAKRNSVNELVSKALEDKIISDVEFRIITREVEKYHELKATIRDGVKTIKKGVFFSCFVTFLSSRLLTAAKPTEKNPKTVATPASAGLTTIPNPVKAVARVADDSQAESEPRPTAEMCVMECVLLYFFATCL